MSITSLSVFEILNLSGGGGKKEKSVWQVAGLLGPMMFPLIVFTGEANWSLIEEYFLFPLSIFTLKC